MIANTDTQKLLKYIQECLEKEPNKPTGMYGYQAYYKAKEREFEKLQNGDKNDGRSGQ